MKMTKRILSFVLCLAMIVGIIPMSVFAEDGTAEGDFTPAGDTDYLFFGTDRHANTSVIGNIINNMESAIGENKLEYLGLGGDMVGSGNSHPTYNSSTVLAEVTGATSSLSATNVDIVAGIHDMNVTDDAGIVLPYQGGCGLLYEGDKYYVYGVEEYCISDDSNETNWSTQSAAFVEWANGSDIDKNKVIIVLSHYPLHVERNDNDGAYCWHQALNTVATGGDSTVERNIVFFHGHNHTVDSNEYIYNVGNTMSIQNGSSTTSATIYYTYATAGYLNQNKKATLMAITDSTITLTKYGTSGSGTAMTSVTRAVPKSLAVTGKIDYNVGDSIVAPTAVNVTYLRADNTTFTSAITEGYKLTKISKDGAEVTLTDNTFTEAGDYVLTYTCTLGGYQAQAELKVTVAADSTEPSVNTVYTDDGVNYIGATALGLTSITAEYTYEANEALMLSTFDNGIGMAYDIALEGHTDGNEITYQFALDETVPAQNLALYHVGTDDALTPVAFELVEVDGVTMIQFTSTDVGTFVYGTVNVPDGYTYSALEVTYTGETDYFLGDNFELYLVDVVAIYKNDAGETFERVLAAYEEGYITDGYTWTDGTLENWIDMTTAGKKELTFTYTDGDISYSDGFTVNVWGKTFTDAETDVTVTVGDSEHGVNNVTVEKLNEDLSDALQHVIAGDNYVAYEIGLSFADSFATKNEQKTVTLPIPEGVTNPVVYYVFADRSQVSERACTISEDGKYITFTTTHFSTYVVGEGLTIETESGNATVEGSSTTTTKDVWVKVDAPADGGQYLIVSTGTAGTAGYIMGGSSVTPVSGTLTVNGTDGTYTYFESTGTVWTASGSGTSWSFKNSSNGYLGYTYTTTNYGSTYYSYTLSTSATEAVIWSLNNNQLYKNLIYRDRSYSSDTYYDYFISGGSSWSMDTDEANVYFYEKKTVSITTGEPGHTYAAEGKDITNAAAIKGQTVELSSQLFDTPDGGTATDITASSGLTPTYELVTTKGNPAVISGIENGVATLSGVAGTAVVKVTYTSGDLVAWDEFTVTAATPDHYSIQLHLNNNNTLGAEINAPVALKGVKAGDTYSVWAVVKACAEAHDGDDHPDGIDLGTLGDALTWSVSNEAIATIDTKTGVITFTGKDYGTFDVTVSYTGADGKIITDTITISATESQFVVPGDGTDDFPEYPNEGAIRHDKTSTAVGNFSETGIAKVELSMSGVPFNTGSEIDVVVMLDMTGSMSDDGMEAAELATIAFMETIVKNTDGTYNDNRIAVYAFNSGSSSPYELVSLKKITSDSELATATTAIKTASDKQTSGGTPFDEAAEKCHDVLEAAKTDGTGNDRKQFCVFMSDGGPTSYEGSDGYTYYGGNNSSGDRALTSYIGGYTSSTSSNWTYNLPTEYWTDHMKEDGVTVYTVGLLLQNAPSNPAPYSSMTDSTYDSATDSLTAIGSHYYFTSTILKNMASDEGKYIDIFDVDNADKATAAFEAIAQDILAAATDVTVADKIGNDYTMVFDAPNASVDEADGGQEYYIEVMDYALVPVYTEASNVTSANFASGNYYTKSGDTYTKATSYSSGTTYYIISDYIRGTGKSMLKLYFGYNESTGYYAATDSAGTAAATPTFAQVALGDKGTKFYWTTDASLADANAVSIMSNGTTYYFDPYGVSSEDEGFDASKWYNMNAGAYASGTNTTQQLYTLVEIDSFAEGVDYYTKNSDGTYTKVTGSYSAEEKYYTHSTSATCQNMIIATPYFVYNAATKMLVWTMDEISASEITLTYFLYLNNSGGFSGTDQEITPDTYTTNQFAYVDYTNFKDVECQLEFPVPQLTWNGAQVSYVFYLVNAQGQPVNRQGRVVPFSEAVYVTDVYTYAIVWNDLEQVAGLSADYLANDLVPNVYALYDNNASYSIHVYEDFKKSNLNNHFVIGGNVTDEYNTSNSWTNANTTMVFNTKADGTKYYVPGAYVADNGNNTANQTGQTYWCKDYNVTGTYEKTEHYDELYGTYYTYTVTSATYNGSEEQVEVTENMSTTGGTQIGDYVYYVDENGEIYTIIEKADGKEVDAGFDFANTTVAFAVVWKPELVEDTIVVDFGLDVVIDVIANDNMVPGVVGVRPEAPEKVDLNTGILENPSKGQTTDVTLNGKVIGTAALIENDTAHIRFSFNKENGMQFNAPVTFYYEANVHFYQDGELKDTHKYSSVTIIPATTVYYEDSFVTFETDNWSVDGTDANKTQNQDRPGESKISADLDADNNYGYDSAYTQMSKYSLGSAHKATVSADSYAVAVFTFYGTGFDIISLTSNTTGTIFVDVYEGAYAKQSDIPAEIINSPAKSFIVDTYYGYAYQSKDMNGDGVVSEGEGEWAITSNTPNSLYQVPVIKVSGLDYKQYTVVICAAYDKFFDHNGTGSYDFYLDAIRIYDPTGNESDVANDAYKADNEGWPTYFEVRNEIIDANSFNSLTDNETSASGIVFIDGGIAEPSIENYISYGPNNELYLADGQAIAFDLNATATAGDVAKVQLAVKTVGGSGKIEVYGVNADGSRIDCLATAVATATDMYYDITALNGKTVVIKNVGSEDDAIISITNVKVTYTEAQPETSEEPAVLMFSIRRSTANAALATMSVEEETVPEETVPEETVPEETVPEETVPEETVPEEPEIFTPEQLKIELSKGKVKEGDKVKVTVKTSGDVAYIVVNGEVVADYRSNRRTGERTWSVTVEAEEAGELEIEVVAYDAKDVASEAVTETVTVEAKKNPAEVVKDILKGVLGWLFG